MRWRGILALDDIINIKHSTAISWVDMVVWILLSLVEDVWRDGRQRMERKI